MTMVTEQTPATFERWICYGRLKDGRECRRVLLEVLPTSAQGIYRKVCDKCGTVNTIQYRS